MPALSRALDADNANLLAGPIGRIYDGGMAKASPSAPVPKTFGDRLHAARLARNLTVNELGIASGLGFKVVQSLESGQRLHPPASEIIGMAWRRDTSRNRRGGSPADSSMATTTSTSSGTTCSTAGGAQRGRGQLLMDPPPLPSSQRPGNA